MSNNSFIIANITIRQDDNGRYCLNDLHEAAGNNSKHKPANWLRIQQAVELISLLKYENCEKQPINIINGGNQRGTYAVKEMVYAYAMWISPAFHLAVIRAYDALVMERLRPVAHQTPTSLLEQHLDQYPNMVDLNADNFKTLRDAANTLELTKKDVLHTLIKEYSARPLAKTEMAALTTALRAKLLTHLYDNSLDVNLRDCLALNEVKQKLNELQLKHITLHEKYATLLEKVAGV